MSDPHLTTSGDHGEHGHEPFLAHHFASAEHQYTSGKLGMWIFLSTEILMFGGLFCAYAVYRHNHPDVFAYAHQYLDKNLGALNTIVLIASSLTMAWAVRLAQINKRRGLLICLGLTLVGGAIFMGVKSVEYHHKWKHHLWLGPSNKYSPEYKGADKPAEHAPLPIENRKSKIENQPDPNTGTADEPRLKPSTYGPTGLAPKVAATGSHAMHYAELSQPDRKRVLTFFGIYFVMTGLHGLHVLIGMGLITWVLIRSAQGAYSSRYFTPVDFVGLYWHVVDLIWIFLFPLLYLIH